MYYNDIFQCGGMNMKKEALIDTTETIEKIRELTDALIRLNGLISE
ncbi:hypothetical protein [Bacillus cereus]|nr:hypothetical protein [Bacillus cereus]